MNSAQIGNV